MPCDNSTIAYRYSTQVLCWSGDGKQMTTKQRLGFFRLASTLVCLSIRRSTLSSLGRCGAKAPDEGQGMPIQVWAELRMHDAEAEKFHGEPSQVPVLCSLRSLYANTSKSRSLLQREL
jgi:hypothetical protein